MSQSILLLPNVDSKHFRVPGHEALKDSAQSTHAPGILLLYGSVRSRSYSRLLAEEAGRLLNAMGAETRFFNPSGLPLPDDAPDTHIRKCVSCESLRNGRRVWCGVHPSVTEL